VQLAMHFLARKVLDFHLVSLNGVTFHLAVMEVTQRVVVMASCHLGVLQCDRKSSKTIVMEIQHFLTVSDLMQTKRLYGYKTSIVISTSSIDIQEGAIGAKVVKSYVCQN
jgi:hypothetical protein